jgi:lipid II:glycine glycyltransferase (peptidoglycan interpeptide bridge formation enzyme)
LEPSLRNVCGKILPEDLQWKNFKPKVRNNYRKAVKLGLRSYVYDSDITEEHISEFYTIYRDTMLRKNAASMYLYDLEYFTNFIFKNPESCSLAMVYYNNIPISTELLLLSGNNVYSFLGGTNADYFTHRPNDLLKICVINWARKRGYSKYVLGGGRFNDDSLYKYKKDFFPKDKDVLFFTGRKVIDQATYDCLVKNSGFDQIENTTNYFPLYRFLSTQ